MSILLFDASVPFREHDLNAIGRQHFQCGGACRNGKHVQTETLRTADGLNPRKKGKNPGNQETAGKVTQT
jgi:hypothetical protein